MSEERANELQLLFYEPQDKAQLIASNLANKIKDVGMSEERANELQLFL